MILVIKVFAMIPVRNDFFELSATRILSQEEIDPSTDEDKVGEFIQTLEGNVGTIDCGGTSGQNFRVDEFEMVDAAEDVKSKGALAKLLNQTANKIELLYKKK